MNASIRSILAEIAAAATEQNITFKLYRQGRKHAIYHLGDSVVLPVPHSKVPSRIRFEMLKACEPELGYRWWMPEHRRPAERADLPDVGTAKGYRGPRRKRAG